jgi:hypothetical protein
MTNTNPTLTMRDLGFDISVWFDRYDTVQPARSRYCYRIVGQDHRDGDPIYAEGDDLTCVGDPDLPEAMRTLLSFWSAACDSYDHAQRTGVSLSETECGTLFPEQLLSLGIDADEVTYTAEWLGGEQ